MLVDLIAGVLAQHHTVAEYSDRDANHIWKCCCGGGSKTLDGYMTLQDVHNTAQRHVVEQVAAALGANHHDEWASEHSGHQIAGTPDPWRQETGTDRGLAQRRVRHWNITHPHATNRLIRQDVYTIRGPWQPVEVGGPDA